MFNRGSKAPEKRTMLYISNRLWCISYLELLDFIPILHVAGYFSVQRLRRCYKDVILHSINWIYASRHTFYLLNFFVINFDKILFYFYFHIMRLIYAWHIWTDLDQFNPFTSSKPLRDFLTINCVRTCSKSKLKWVWVSIEQLWSRQHY